MFVEDPIAPLPVGLEAYWQGVQRLEGRYQAAATFEAAKREGQEHAARLAAAVSAEGAAAERAEQAQGAGQGNTVDGGSSGAAEAAASRTGAARAAEADVNELPDSDGEEPAPAAKRPRPAPPKPRAQASLAARAAPAPMAQAAATAAAKDGVWNERAVIPGACAPQQRRAAGGRCGLRPATSQWMTPAGCLVVMLICIGCSPPRSSTWGRLLRLLVLVCDCVLNLVFLLNSFLCLRDQSLDGCSLQPLHVLIFLVVTHCLSMPYSLH